MKTRIILFICFSVLFVNFLSAQIDQKARGGEFKFNPSNEACVTVTQRKAIDSIIQHHTKSFAKRKSANAGMIQLFDWPVRKAEDTPYFDIWAISNFVDHNIGFPNQTTDYNCGSRTYDTANGYNHQGTDIYTWPFSWHQFQNDMAEVIAAAPGTIVYKSDGNFDQNCEFNSDNWNAIYIQHSDGSIAMYGHMKSNSLNLKDIGDFVNTGEYLGVIGSSGNSTGPHLHFEVFDNNGELIDPYTGNCNNMNSDFWWSSPKDYRDPGINALLTLNNPPAFNDCPQLETINEQNNFEYGETAYFSIYLRDQMPGMVVNYKLISPSGGININWSQTLSNTYNSSYWFYSFNIQQNNFAEEGYWTFEITFNNQTESIGFGIGDDLVSSQFEFEENLKLYPNPFKNNINIDSGSKIKFVKVYDISGKLIKTESNPNSKIETTSFSSGVYFIEIHSIDDQKVVKQLLKQ